MSKLLLFVGLSVASLAGLLASAVSPTGLKAAGSCCTKCDDCPAGCGCCTGGPCLCGDGCACVCCAAKSSLTTAGKSACCATKGVKTVASATHAGGENALLAASNVSVAGAAAVLQSSNAGAGCCAKCSDCGADCACCAAKSR
jgi:hypothetical protein